MALTADDLEAVKEVAERLKQVRNILFITGAGLSADSNLPTYRGVGGLYNDDRTEDGVPIEVALSGNMLLQRPDVSWRHIARIEEACRGASFNRGHEVIAMMEKAFPRVWVLTQNVDGFHRAAGSKNVIDIHGDIHDIYCTVCPYRETVKDYAHFTELVPKCPDCGGVVRPDVVLFGEMLPHDKFARFSREEGIGFDMVFSIGTSSLFPYIVEPVVRARFSGVHTVEINPGTTDISHMVSYKIGTGAAEALDAIWNQYQGKAQELWGEP